MQGQQETAASVPQADRPAAEAREQAGAMQALRQRWSWAEASVWTEKMLTALEQGVKRGGVWFSLIDKVYSAKNLSSAWTKVLRNKGSAGVDHVTVAMYQKHEGANLKNLSEQLRQGKYQPSSIRRVWIPKPGSDQKRPLGIPTVRDRVVQGAVRQVLEPIFEKTFAPHSYGFRPGKGCKDALRRVDELLKRGYRYVVDADLKGYFDTIPHGKLIERVKEQVVDGRVLKLIESFLKQNVMEGLEQWRPTTGAPQGAVLSPLLSNIYLNPLDQLMQREGIEMVRYADDFVVLCRSLDEAEAALKMVKCWTEQSGLTLHPDKTRIADMQQDSFEFLGYRFDSRGRKWPRDKSMTKLKDAIRAKTPRCAGHSLGHIIADVNRTLRGWFEYFKHAHRATFKPVDGFVRRRLRTMLRKRHRQRGGAWGGSNHQRWPNLFFTTHGLFSLDAARAQLVNPMNR